MSQLNPLESSVSRSAFTLGLMVLLMIVRSHALQAADPVDVRTPLSLDDAIRQALTCNPRIQASMADARAQASNAQAEGKRRLGDFWR